MYLFLLLFLGSMVLTYAIAVIMDMFRSTNRIEGAIQRDITQQTTLLVTSAVSLVTTPILSLWRSFTTVVTSMITNTKWVVAAIMVAILAVSFHLYHDELLQSMDESWRCAVHPAFQNIVVPVTQIARALYATIVPIYNLTQLVIAQLIKGSGVILFKCTASNFILPVIELFKAIGAFTGALFQFLGGTAPISVDNNIVVNEFSIEAPLNHTMAALTSWLRDHIYGRGELRGRSSTTTTLITPTCATPPRGRPGTWVSSSGAPLPPSQHG